MMLLGRCCVIWDLDLSTAAVAKLSSLGREYHAVASQRRFKRSAFFKSPNYFVGEPGKLNLS